MEVQLQDVTKEFHSKHGSVTAVNSLSLKISSGKLVGLLGPSGCGKSTALFLLAGIHSLTGGRILFDGEDVSSLPPEKRGIGMVFQNYALYPHLTVEQNIEFPLLNSKTLKSKMKQEWTERASAFQENTSFKQYISQKVREVACLVEIEDYLDRKPAELSGGQQQRVAIARAIVKRPSLLLLDEPLSNLDARLRVQTRAEIHRIQRQTGITMIFVTHDQEEALDICDEIAILKNGELQQYGEPQDIYDNPANRFVAEFLGSMPVNILNGYVEHGNLYIAGLPVRRGLLLPDGPVTAAIRPENVLNSPNEGCDFFGEVTRLTRNGGLTAAEISLEHEERIQILKEARSVLREGDRVCLSVMENRICVFGKEGERLCRC